jgi:uncharacterized membrane protein
MTTFRSEDTLVGLVALLVVPWIVWTLQRGLRDQRLPIGRTYILRSERPGAFTGLAGFYLLSALVMVCVALDLLMGIDVRRWL